MKIDEIDSRWLRVPLPRTIANSTHVLRFIDWIIDEVASGDWGVGGRALTTEAVKAMAAVTA